MINANFFVFLWFHLMPSPWLVSHFEPITYFGTITDCENVELWQFLWHVTQKICSDKPRNAVTATLTYLLNSLKASRCLSRILWQNTAGTPLCTVSLLIMMSVPVKDTKKDKHWYPVWDYYCPPKETLPSD